MTRMSLHDVGIVGVDPATSAVHLRGAAADGSALFRRKARRGQIPPFLSWRPGCTVAMVACASARHRARAIAELGHVVTRIRPVYVWLLVKRRKNGAADAEAIAEAASRPTERVVAAKTEAQLAAGMACRTGDRVGASAARPDRRDDVGDVSRAKGA